MAFENTNPVTEDNATKADDYDVVFDNTLALLYRRSKLSLGGYGSEVYSNTTYQELFYPVDLRIDGTTLGGDMVWKIHFMCKVSSGATGYVKLYNMTDTADVASSEVSFVNTAPFRRASSAITLATGLKSYEALVKVASGTMQVWDIALVGE